MFFIFSMYLWDKPEQRLPPCLSELLGKWAWTVSVQQVQFDKQQPCIGSFYKARHLLGARNKKKELDTVPALHVFIV